MAPHSSTLAWKIPWTEEPGGLQSRGSLRVGHDWATSLWLSLSCIGEGNGNPFQCSCLENPRDGGAWWAAIYGAAQSWTRLKQLSSSSSSSSKEGLMPTLTMPAIVNDGVEFCPWCDWLPSAFSLHQATEPVPALLLFSSAPSHPAHELLCQYSLFGISKTRLIF